MDRNSRLAAILFAMTLLVGLSAAAHGESEPVSVRALAFSPDGRHLAVGFGTREVAGGLLVWNVQEQSVERTIAFKQGVHSLALSPDGKRLALATYDHAPQLYLWPSLEAEPELEATRRGPVAFSPDGGILAMGSEDRRIYCWEVASQTDKQSLSGHRDVAFSIAFSPDGKRIASAAQAGVLVWDVATGAEQLSLKHGRSLTSSAMFSPDGRWILTGGWDGTTRIWDAETGALRTKLSGTGGVDRIALVPELDMLAVSGTGRVINLFAITLDAASDEAMAKIREVLERLEDESYEVREAASAELVKIGFSAEAELRRLEQDSPSAELRIRARRAHQAITSQPLAVLNEHSARIRCLSVCPGRNVLATGGDDGSVRLWDLVSQKSVATIHPAELAAGGKAVIEK